MKRVKLTEEEKARRRHERKAEALNHRARAEAGMFADVPGEVVLTTAEEVAEKRRRIEVAKADGTEDGSVRYRHTWNRPLEELKLKAVERLAAGLLGEWFPKLYAYAHKTYPKVFGCLGGKEYHRSFWRARLTTAERLDVEFHGETYQGEPSQWNPSGVKFRLVVDLAFPPGGWVPPLTPEQFDAMFPTSEPELGPEPDDGGLFELVMAALTKESTCG